jgi:hypothetical protein
MIKEDLDKLKNQLLQIEQNLQVDMGILNEKEQKFKSLDEKAAVIINTSADDIVKLNIGGKRFATTVKTLMTIPDTLFYKIIITKCVDFMKEIFIARN